MSDVFKFEYIEPQNIILNKNKEDRGTYIEGTKSGITLKTLQQPTDITIRSDFYAGNFDSVISVRNSYNTDQFFGSSINSTPEEQYIGDEFVLYRTGFAFTGSFSEGPFIRLGRNNIISEKSNSKLGIGTLLPAEKVHISGGNLRVEGDVFANNLYTKDNPSGFITGVNLSSYATATNLNNTGSTLNIKIDSVSGYLQNQINNISGGGGGGVTGDYYPNSNPSGFITGIDTSNFYTKDNPSGFITGVDTSSLYPRSNPSGFITGIDLSSYATNANLNLTGSTLNTKINNLSGVSVLTFGDQIINGTKYFTNDVYIHDLYVTGTEFIANVENNFIESPYILLNLTGGAIDGGIFFVTGTGLTGVNDYGPIIGFDHSNKFKFGIARRSDDLSILNDIAAVQDITNYSGFVDNKYYTKDNLSGYITNENVVFTTGNQNIDGTKIFSNKLIANSGVDIYFSQTAGTGVFVSGLWNNTGQTYVGIRYDVRLASGVAPSITNSLANIRVNNTGVFNINSKGQVLIQQLAGVDVYDNTFEVRRGNNSYFSIRDDGTVGVNNSNGLAIAGSPNAAIRNGVITIGNGGYFGIGNTSDAYNYPNEHTVRLYRGGDFILDLRNATYPTSGHQFRVFNISATNTGEFGLFGWQRTGTTGTPNALVIGAQATQSGILREVILSGRNLRIPTGDLFIGTTGAGTSRILLANPAGTNFYHITPAQYNLSIGHLGGNALTIDSNYISSNTNFTLNGAGYLFGEGTNRFIGLRDTYGGNNTAGGNNQGLNIYKVYSGLNNGFATREFLTLGWTGFTGIIGTRIGQSGTLRDLIITGANINISTSGTTNFNNRPTVNGTGVLLSGEGGSVDLSAYATKIDLASTGTTLNTKIDSFSGFANDNFYLKSNPSGFITGVDLSNYVTKTNAEFTNRPTVNGTGILLSGEALQVLPNTIVYTTGNQTISGVKSFIGDHFISGNTTVTGHFAATSKSFLITHPTDSSKKLQYGSLESPYHGIRLTDSAKIVDDSVIVELPKYISSLVNEEKTNIQLTNINHSKVLFVKEVNVAQNYFTVGIDRGWFDKKEYEFYWSFTAERKDVPQLEVEF